MKAFYHRAQNAITSQIISQEGTIYSIDLWRGLASIVVVAFHHVHFFMGNSDHSWTVDDIKYVEFYEVWAPLADWGANAVQFFWVISGFIFVHVYCNKLEVTGRKFLISRIARLYPLHFVTLILVAIIQSINMRYFDEFSIYSINDFYHYMLNLFFASELDTIEGFSFNGPIWSVSAEIASYFLFFIILKTGRINILTFFTLSVLFFLFHIFTENLVILCAAFFFSGCAAYGVMQFFQRMNISLATVILVSVIIISIQIVGKSDPLQRGIPYVPLFCAILILSYILEKKIGYKTLRKMQWLGNASYGNYLWHCPLQLIFLLFVAFGAINIEIIFRWYFICLYIGSVLTVSLISYRFFERPAQKFILENY